MRSALVLLICTACSAPATRAPVRSEPDVAVAAPAATPTPIANAPIANAPIANQAVAARGDTDKDQIPDDVDRCPDTPEDWDAFADTDGCPDLDDDGDGFADADDMCPDAQAPPPTNKKKDDNYRRGCPPEKCTQLIIDTSLDDCFLTSLYEAGMQNQDEVLRKLVGEVASFPEIYEVTLRAFRLTSEPKAAGLARLEPIRARLIALGWPARIPLVLTTETTSNPETQNLINGHVSEQRFTYERNFRPGICTTLGHVYRPERPETKCTFRRR